MSATDVTKKPYQCKPGCTGCYDKSKVPGVKCINCKLPIGDLPWREVSGLARLGQMMFEHETCPAGGAAQ